jgi:hypothetical protein
MWENIVESDRPQKTILHARFICLIAKATDAHSEYVILFAFHGNNGYANAPRYYVYTPTEYYKITDAQQTKENVRTAAMPIVCITQKYYFNKATHFPKAYYYLSFWNLKISGASDTPTSSSLVRHLFSLSE